MRGERRKGGGKDQESRVRVMAVLSFFSSAPNKPGMAPFVYGDVMIDMAAEFQLVL